MVDNLLFLDHPHACINCKSTIDMQKIKQFIEVTMRRGYDKDYYHQIMLAKPYDPVIVTDYGNDVEIICSLVCMINHYNSEEVSFE